MQEDEMAEAQRIGLANARITQLELLGQSLHAGQITQAQFDEAKARVLAAPEAMPSPEERMRRLEEAHAAGLIGEEQYALMKRTFERMDR